jgi:hypothetical protein
MILRHRGPDAALKWFADENLAVRDLTINGLQSLAATHLQTEDFDRAGLGDVADESPDRHSRSRRFVLR